MQDLDTFDFSPSDGNHLLTAPIALGFPPEENSLKVDVDVNGDGFADVHIEGYDIDSDGALDSVAVYIDADFDGQVDTTIEAYDSDLDGMLDTAVCRIDLTGDGMPDIEETSSIDPIAIEISVS